MKLGLAGAISGMGQGLGQGLQTLNSGLVQMGVQQSLAKNDKEFQMEKLRIQMEHENQMTDRKIAGDKENTAAQIAAQGLEARKTQRLKGLQDEDLLNAKTEADKDLLNTKLEAEKTEAFAKLGLTKQMHDEDLAAAEKRFKLSYSQDERKMALQEGKVMTVTTGDGRIALLSPNGKAKGYLTDGKGNEIKAPADLPKSTLFQLSSLADEMHDMSKEYAKQLVHTPEQEEAYKRQKLNLRAQMEELVLAATGKATPKPEKGPVVTNLGPWQNFKDTRAGATQAQPPVQVPYRPGATPAPPVKKPSGLVEDLKKTPSWMDLLSPNRK